MKLKNVKLYAAPLHMDGQKYYFALIGFNTEIIQVNYSIALITGMGYSFFLLVVNHNFMNGWGKKVLAKYWKLTNKRGAF